MKKFKKVFCLLLAVVFVLGMTVGCEKKEDVSQKNPTPSKKTEAKKQDSDIDKEPELEYRKLSWYFPGVAQKDEKKVEAELNKYLKEKINAEIDMNFIDWGSWDNKKNMMVASGEEFDIIFTAAWSDFLSDMSKGAFFDITDYWDTILKGTKEALHPLFIEGSKIDGRNYAIPCNKEIGLSTAIVYRKDITDELGIDMSNVKTYKDFTEVFKRVHEAKPEIVPFYTSKTGTMEFPGTTSIQVADSGFPLLVDENLKVKSMFEFDEEVNWLNTIHEWYTKGYINQDAPTTQATVNDVCRAGKVFSYCNVTHPGKQGQLKLETGLDWGSVELTPAVANCDSVMGSMMAVSRTSKDPERALMFLNLMNTDKYVNNLVNFGIESEHYVKVDDNIITFPEGIDAKNSPYNPACGWELGGQLLNYVWDFEQPDKWEQYKKFNDNCIPSKLMGFSFKVEPVKTQYAACQNVIKEFQGSLATGAGDPAKELPKIKAKLKANGLDDIIKKAQKQIDDWRAETGK